MSCWFSLALAPVVLGALMTALGEVNFHLLGFTLACGACLCRAGKSVSQGRLLSAEDERLDAVNLMAHMCPISALLLAVFALPREVGPILAWVDDFRRDESRNAHSFLAFLASWSGLLLSPSSPGSAGVSSLPAPAVSVTWLTSLVTRGPRISI